MTVARGSRFDRFMPVLIALGMLGLLAWYGYRYWLWQQDLQAMPQSTVVPATETPREQPKPDREKLFALFGKAAPEAPVAPPVKESTLSLKLLASYVAAEGGRSAAVIAGNGKKDKLYYPGDKILPGVELVAVQTRRVLIKHNGVLESVSLEESKRGSAPTRGNDAQPVVAHAPAVVPKVAEPISRQKLTERLNKLRALARGEK